MRSSCCLMAAFLAAAPLAGQGAASSPRLQKAELGPAPWNVNSGGIAALDVKVDDKGAVTSADVVQDVAPYGGMLLSPPTAFDGASADSLKQWRFRPASRGNHKVPSRAFFVFSFVQQ